MSKYRAVDLLLSDLPGQTTLPRPSQLWLSLFSPLYYILVLSFQMSLLELPDKGPQVLDLQQLVPLPPGTHLLKPIQCVPSSHFCFSPWHFFLKAESVYEFPIALLGVGILLTGGSDMAQTADKRKERRELNGKMFTKVGRGVRDS